MSTLQATRYGVEAIQEEAKRLVQSGVVRRSEPIDHLRAFFPDREWIGIAEELLIQDFQFSDRICDLLGCEEWNED